MAAIFRVDLVDPSQPKNLDNEGYRRDLCRIEVEQFNQWLRENEPNWKDGMSNWEKQAVHVYLDKKSRRLDEQSQEAPSDLPQKEQPHGPA